MPNRTWSQISKLGKIFFSNIRFEFVSKDVIRKKIEEIACQGMFVNISHFPPVKDFSNLLIQ